MLRDRRIRKPWNQPLGNVLRRDYESIAAPLLWKLAQADLPALEKACRSEFAAEERRLSGK
jgi:uncharacterized protein with HEPN domain